MRSIIYTLLIIVITITSHFPPIYAQNENTLNPAFSLTNSLILSLEDVSFLAIQNNFNIQLARYDAKIARLNKKNVQSIYDTIATAEVAYQNDQAARTNTFSGTQLIDNDYDLSLKKKVPSGTTISIDSTNRRQWTDSAFTTGNPSHNSTIRITAEQSLGRNFFGLQDRGEVKLTLSEILTSERVSLEKIQDELLQVQKAYLELVREEERERVAADMKYQAQQLLQIHQEKYKKGLVEEPVLLAAQANYEQRTNDEMLTSSQLKSKMNVLKIFLNWDESSGEISSDDRLTSLVEPERPLSELLKAALTNRHDYQRLMNELKSRDIQLALKKNNVWPEINLSASFAQNGISTKDFNGAVDDLEGREADDYSVGIKVSVPLENSKASAELDRVKLEKARTLVAIKSLERQITLEVFDHARALRINHVLAQNAQKIADIQSAKLEAEQKRFNSGRSSTDLVIRYQEDVLDAKWKAVEAKVRYVESVFEFKKSTGELLLPYWNQDF